MSNGTESFITIDIGGTKCAISLADGTPRFVERRELATREQGGPEAVLRTLGDWAEELIALAEGDVVTRPVAVGISSGGPLSRTRGRILGPPNLPGWEDVPIVSYFEDRLGLPTFLENDANASALAEWQFGAGKGFSNVIFLTFGTGMGAGLILGGKLYRGTNDLAGEVGHIRLSDTGPVGYGKSGSFEGYCSGGGLGRQGATAAEEAASRGERCGLCPQGAAPEEVTAKDVAEAARAGDPQALRIIRESARQLGRGLAILMDIINPERIIIGSVYARSEDLFRHGALQELAKEALPGAVEACEVVPAALRDHVGDYAALAAATYGMGES